MRAACAPGAGDLDVARGALVGFLLAFTMAAGLGFVTIDVPARQDPFRAEPVLEKALQQEPVVISEGQLFLRMWHYAPERLKGRVLFLADHDAAVETLSLVSTSTLV